MRKPQSALSVSSVRAKENNPCSDYSQAITAETALDVAGCNKADLRAT